MHSAAVPEPFHFNTYDQYGDGAIISRGEEKEEKKKHHRKTELSRGCVFGIRPMWVVFPVECFVADPLPLRNSTVTLRAGHHITHPEGFHSKAHDTGNRKGDMHRLGRHLL